MEKILIIDDSLTQADLLKAILETDYSITITHDSQEGLRLARSEEHTSELQSPM